MKIKVKKTMTHGEFAKYIVDKFGITSFERNLAGAECFGVPSDMYIASINLNPAKFDDFAHSIRIDEDGVKIETFEEITEDTVFEYLINVYRGNGRFMELDTNECINEYNVANLTEVHAYIDGEFKLIWRDGKLVE